MQAKHTGEILSGVNDVLTARGCLDITVRLTGAALVLLCFSCFDHYMFSAGGVLGEERRRGVKTYRQRQLHDKQSVFFEHSYFHQAWEQSAARSRLTLHKTLTLKYYVIIEQHTGYKSR